MKASGKEDHFPNHPSSEEEELRTRRNLHNERAREYRSDNRCRLETIARGGHSITTRALLYTTAAAKAQIQAVRAQSEPVKDDGEQIPLRAYM